MKRIDKMLSLSKSVPYTNEELRVLKDLIDNNIMDENGITNDNFLELYCCLIEIISNGSYYIDRPSGTFKRLNFLEYLLVYFRKVYLFLTCVSVKNVPLYINDAQLSPFVQWRLFINK